METCKTDCNLSAVASRQPLKDHLWQEKKEKLLPAEGRMRSKDHY